MKYRLIFTLILLLMPACSSQGASSAIVFVSKQSDNQDIYIRNLEDSTIRQLTFNKADDYFPSLSPDGEHVVFVSNRNYLENNRYSSVKTDIFTIDVDGSNTKQLTENPSLNTMPAWSPDGKHIAFVSNRNGGIPHVFVVDSDGSNLRQLTYGRYDISPTWSPDSQYIAFISNRLDDSNITEHFAIYTIKADGTNEKRLTNTFSSEAVALDWSPDGKKILFLADPKDFSEQDFDLFILNMNDFEVTRITTDGLVYSRASWLPDGQHIIFDKEVLKHSGKSKIVVVDLNSFSETEIDLSTLVNIYSPSSQR
jgi:TolB protein